jgi:hypothetical protein
MAGIIPSPAGQGAPGHGPAKRVNSLPQCTGLASAANSVGAAAESAAYLWNLYKFGTKIAWPVLK